MAKKFIEKLTDAKSRTLVLLGIGIVIILLIASYFIFSKGSSAEQEASQAPRIPEITSIPGQVTSEKYQQLLEQANIKRAEEAQKQGTSAVATIIGSREKDILAKRESFGIEDEFLRGSGECKCPCAGPEKPCSPPIDDATLSKLTKQIEANENSAIALMKGNPCLASRLSQTRPDLLKRLMQNPEFAKQFAQLAPDVVKNMMKSDPAFAAQMMQRYPDMVRELTKNDPQFSSAVCKSAIDDATLARLTKQIQANEDAAIGLMKANPCLAKRLEETNPALLKKLMQNPEFAREFAKMHPDVLKDLMRSDPAFAAQMIKKYPSLVNDLIKNDPKFADEICKKSLDDATLAKLTQQIEADESSAINLMKANPCLAKRLQETNPALLKKLMQNPEFAKEFAKMYPDVVKDLMKNDPVFAKQMLQKNPELVKDLLNNDPQFAKDLMKSDPEVAAQIMQKYPDMVKDLMKSDPQFANDVCKKTLDDEALARMTKQIEADENSAITLMKANPCLAKRLQETNPALLKKLMQNPEFAKEFAKMYPDVVKDLMKNDPDFAKQMYAKYPDMVKDLMRGDDDFARTIAKNNPAIMKDLMLKDPEFAKLMARNDPDMVKELMRKDPAFSAALAKNNPALVKEFMKNDPAFAREVAQLAPDMVKQLMNDDPDFARNMATASPGMVSDLMRNDPEFAKTLVANTPGLNALMKNAIPQSAFANDQARIAALEEERRKRLAQQAEDAKRVQLSELQQKQLAAVVGNMEGQTKAMFQAWNEMAPQQFVVGEWRNKEAQDKNANGGGAGGPGSSPDDNPPGTQAKKGPIIIKAGTILYAVLETAINTDEPGPVMASIIAGPYAGAKVIGNIQFVQQAGSNRPEKVSLNFTTLSLPNQAKSTSISAVAVDPDTARTALASNVDHHYLLRYGTLFASSFLQGYAKVITSMGTTQTTATNGLATTTTTPSLSTRQQIFAALGQVGQNFGQVFAGYVNLPNTITVNTGTSIGLLILTDVTLN